MRDPKISPNTQVLITVLYDLPFNETLESHPLEKFNQFDGFYIPWFNAFYYRVYDELQNTSKRDVITQYLQTIKNKFENKTIVAHVGPEWTIENVFDYTVFKENVDFVVLEGRGDISPIHHPNYKGIYLQEDPIIGYQKNQVFLVYLFHRNFCDKKNLQDALASTWMNHSFPQERLSIYTGAPGLFAEPRFKVCNKSYLTFACIHP